MNRNLPVIRQTFSVGLISLLMIELNLLETFQEMKRVKKRIEVEDMIFRKMETWFKKPKKMKRKTIRRETVREIRMRRDAMMGMN